MKGKSRREVGTLKCANPEKPQFAGPHSELSTWNEDCVVQFGPPDSGRPSLFLRRVWLGSGFRSNSPPLDILDDFGQLSGIGRLDHMIDARLGRAQPFHDFPG